ncbi:ribokinase [Yinghuangia soli]|uniref:Ribokinase n=1 Tax=Yinghuangia soli TaxID=2908204 RepID=A0AA41Q210_9ACTN|nr:ribokinase [Yinghuangia soli]MCF2529856.1 ribokinase [Yinghuangia soli]
MSADQGAGHGAGHEAGHGAGHEAGLLVVGSVNADLVVRVPRHPRPGETVLGGDLAVHPGGKGANQAVAAARLGAQVAFAGRVGSDAHGSMLVDGLRRDGVDVSLVGTEPGPSGVALITVDGRGENAITVSPGANGRLGPDAAEALEPALRAAAVVSLQLEIPHETVAEIMRRCGRAGTRVVLNLSPGPWAAPTDVWRLCDPLVVNEHEALDAAARPGDGTAESALAPVDRARRIMRGTHAVDARPRSLVLTLGAAGAICIDGDGEPAHVPAPAVEAVDTTGAGDAFTGALAWRLACGDSLLDAVRYAVRAGAAAVTAEGAQPSYPTPDRLPLL